NLELDREQRLRRRAYRLDDVARLADGRVRNRIGELAAVRRVLREARVELEDPLAELVDRLRREPDRRLGKHLDARERKPERAPAREELLEPALAEAEREEERDVERDPGRLRLGVEAGAELLEARLGQHQAESSPQAHASRCTSRR